MDKDVFRLENGEEIDFELLERLGYNKDISTLDGISIEKLVDITKQLLKNRGIASEDDDFCMENIKDVASFYINVLYIMFKDMYLKGELLSGRYTVRKDINCDADLIGVYQISPYLHHGKLQKEEYISGYYIGINTVIMDCFEVFFVPESIDYYGDKLYKKVKQLIREVFDSDLLYRYLDVQGIEYISDRIVSGLDNKIYSQYEDILYVCKFYLEDEVK